MQTTTSGEGAATISNIWVTDGSLRKEVPVPSEGVISAGPVNVPVALSVGGEVATVRGRPGVKGETPPPRVRWSRNAPPTRKEEVDSRLGVPPALTRVCDSSSVRADVLELVPSVVPEETSTSSLAAAIRHMVATASPAPAPSASGGQVITPNCELAANAASSAASSAARIRVSRQKNSVSVPVKQCHSCGSADHLARNCAVPRAGKKRSLVIENVAETVVKQQGAVDSVNEQIAELRANLADGHNIVNLNLGEMEKKEEKRPSDATHAEAVKNASGACNDFQLLEWSSIRGDVDVWKLVVAVAAYCATVASAGRLLFALLKWCGRLTWSGSLRAAKYMVGAPLPLLFIGLFKAWTPPHMKTLFRVRFSHPTLTYREADVRPEMVARGLRKVASSVSSVLVEKRIADDTLRNQLLDAFGLLGATVGTTLPVRYSSDLGAFYSMDSRRVDVAFLNQITTYLTDSADSELAFTRMERAYQTVSSVDSAACMEDGDSKRNALYVASLYAKYRAQKSAPLAQRPVRKA